MYNSDHSWEEEQQKRGNSLLKGRLPLTRYLPALPAELKTDILNQYPLGEDEWDQNHMIIGILIEFEGINKYITLSERVTIKL
ncbi:MAG: hypothetical protein CVV33_02985 [Methanomicrobiales archaeon HGW-Methanomicrobiales-4]|nr:MAG: hypothetical protein CVV33_02985 [Methanomicrobiales archaeon HGW-Methanomicrobiales-4]